MLKYKKLKKSTLFRFISFWPPFLGAGIRVTHISPDVTSIEVEMKLRFWNKNYFGTQYGGSLYSMTDPFLALILVEQLGRNYIVWDKVGTIRYLKPGRTTVHATITISKEKIEEIRVLAQSNKNVEPHFKIDILDETNEIVAQVEKVLYVRHKG